MNEGVGAIELAEPPSRATATLMHGEAAEAGAVVGRMLDRNVATFARIAERLRAAPPSVVVTCARGSSDHAATYAKYLIETFVGVPTASAAPSISSIYAAPIVGGQRLCLAISQSGRSPDLLQAVKAQRAAGAFVVALVNAEDAPLRALADETVLLSAGAERSVAATKSYIASLAAIAAMVAAWSGDTALADAVHGMPTELDRAFELDWSAAIEPLSAATNLFLIGRGYGLGVAEEAALKLKETCGLHAEAFSAAEVKHGPMAIVGEGFPVLAFAGNGEAGDDVRATAAMFRDRGATVLLADVAGGVGALPAIAAHPAVEPVLAIQSFYRMANALSVARGLDPDTPPFLKKVTQTR